MQRSAAFAPFSIDSLIATSSPVTAPCAPSTFPSTTAAAALNMHLPLLYNGFMVFPRPGSVGTAGTPPTGMLSPLSTTGGGNNGAGGGGGGSVGGTTTNGLSPGNLLTSGTGVSPHFHPSAPMGSAAAALAVHQHLQNFLNSAAAAGQVFSPSGACTGLGFPFNPTTTALSQPLLHHGHSTLPPPSHLGIHAATAPLSPASTALFRRDFLSRPSISPTPSSPGTDNTRASLSPDSHKGRHSISPNGSGKKCMYLIPLLSHVPTEPLRLYSRPTCLKALPQFRLSSRIVHALQL